MYTVSDLFSSPHLYDISQATATFFQFSMETVTTILKSLNTSSIIIALQQTFVLTFNQSLAPKAPEGPFQYLLK